MEIDNIVESIGLANSMIDAAEPGDREGIEVLVDIVGSLKTSESVLIETISNIDQDELLDYAIKVNDDFQTTIRRFRQLQKGKRPSEYRPTHNKNFDKNMEEEVKLEVSDNGYSDTSSNYE